MNLKQFIGKCMNSYSLKDPTDTYPKYSWTIVVRDKDGWKVHTPTCGVDASKESIACDLAKSYFESHGELYTDYEGFIRDLEKDKLDKFLESKNKKNL